MTKLMNLANCTVFAKLYSPIAQISLTPYIIAILDELAKPSSAKQIIIVNGERFTSLIIHRFHPMKFFTGKLQWCLMFKALKQCHYTKLVYIHGKTFAVLLKTAKNMKV